MSGRTQRFGLNTFGPRVGGTIAEQGGKFSDADRRTLDAILTAFESHSHARGGGGKLPDPSGLPGASQATTGGMVPGGRTFFYAYTFVDKYGLESGQSQTVQVSTPAIIQAPPPPDTQSAMGGSLPAGMYFYGLTYLTAAGVETPLSNPSVVTLVPGDGTVTVGLYSGLPDGVSNVRVWRQAAGKAGYTKVGVFDPSGNALFTDDGSIPDDPCACDPANLPPRINAVSSTNSITIDLAPEDAAIVQDPANGVRAWRLYRTEVQNSWGGQDMVREVVEPSDQNDPESPLSAQTVDVGGELLYGTPPSVSQCLTDPTPMTQPILSSLNDDAADGVIATFNGLAYVRANHTWQQLLQEVDATPAGTFPEGTVVSVQGVLNRFEAGAWVPKGGGTGGGTVETYEYGRSTSWSPTPFVMQSTMLPVVRATRPSDRFLGSSEPTNWDYFGFTFPPGAYYVTCDVLIDATGRQAGDVLSLAADALNATMTLDVSQLTSGVGLSVSGVVYLTDGMFNPMFFAPAGTPVTLASFSLRSIATAPPSSSFPLVVGSASMAPEGPQFRVTWTDPNVTTVLVEVLPLDDKYGTAAASVSAPAADGGTGLFDLVPGMYQVCVSDADGGQFVQKQLVDIATVA